MGGGLLGRLDAGPQSVAGGLPVGQPDFRFADQLVVGPGLALQSGPLGVNRRAAQFGPLRGFEPAELLPEPSLQLRKLFGTGVRQSAGQHRTGPVTGLTGHAVGALGLVAQVQCRCDEVRLAGPCESFVAAVAVGAAVLEHGGPAARLLVPLLECGQFAFAVECLAGGRLPALGHGEDAGGDVETFAGDAAGRGGPLQHALGEARFAGLDAGERRFTAAWVRRPGRFAERPRGPFRPRP